jgi:transposase
MKTMTKTSKQTPKAPIFAPSIVAIDLGKFKSVACGYDAKTGECQYHTFVTERKELHAVLDRFEPEVVVIEACSLAGWVRDACVAYGYACQVANTSSEAWKFKHVKRKTDRDDALRLALLAASGQLPTVALPAKAVREQRALIAGRQRLVGRRVAAQNRIRSILVGQGLAMPRGAKAWTAAGLGELAALSRPLTACGPEEFWRGLLGQALTEYGQVAALLAELEKALDALAGADAKVRLLQTIPGVGPRTAEAVAAHLDDATRFKTGGQVSAYAGLVPKQFQSGEVDRRGRITRRGPALLRKLLVECAWCLLRYNDWARTVWLRLTHGGKVRRKQGIVALARKLLVRCWAMLRDGLPWRVDPLAVGSGQPAVGNSL